MLTRKIFERSNRNIWSPALMKASSCKDNTSNYDSDGKNKIDYGILCDVDGVLTRGPVIIEAAANAFQLLRDKDGKWKAPVVFLTNASNVLKQQKSTEISKILKMHISPKEIVMAHSPLSEFSELFNHHVAVCGQGPINEIARNIGFLNVSSIDEISAAFPLLDACRPKKQIRFNTSPTKIFKKVEAIILFGEPERWEHKLQIILDLLFNNGDLRKTMEDVLYDDSQLHSHLPIFACSSDMVWAAEAASPRIAHGSFLVCLETLLKRITGRRLKYTALIGKPSPFTYAFALAQLNAIASKQFRATEPLQRVYCIGDNPEVDIYGANLFNLCLQHYFNESIIKMPGQIHSSSKAKHLRQLTYLESSLISANHLEEFSEHLKSCNNNMESLSAVLRNYEFSRSDLSHFGIFKTILVLTGVYQEHRKLRNAWARHSESNSRVHPNFPHLPTLSLPDIVAMDIEEAVKDILYLEERNYSYSPPTMCCPQMDGNFLSP